MNLLCQASVSTSRQHVGGSVDQSRLSREIQELRVELSQKNLKLESTEAECHHKIAELEQKLGDSLHQRQMLQVKTSKCAFLCLKTFLCFQWLHYC